ncbi:MAG: ATP-dependent sacrificial sulfur transferase LarE [Thermoanaerobaculia bacterium]|nr:ATP-dependent sacrificial sulfur transferase LarE [Thermoanaerobaculia bacterium]
MAPESIETSPVTYLEKLENELRRYDSLVVAFSGGVDSAVLLAAAGRCLGSRAVAFTADSPSIPRSEIELARSIAAGVGVEHHIEPTAELANEDYSRNDEKRCYFCKQTLFDSARAFAAGRGIAHIAYGFTADDAGDYRPGQQAAEEHGIRRPLFDAGLGKAEIRAIAKLLGLEIWDKPAAPCLASRIPYGSAVTGAKLSHVEQMEALLHELGFRVCRARYDGTTMRIELEGGDISRAAMPQVRQRLLELGAQLEIPLVTLDLEGFKSGKLNREIGR